MACVPYLLASVFVQFLHVAPFHRRGAAAPVSPIVTTARPMATALDASECPACDWLRASTAGAIGGALWLACDDAPAAVDLPPARCPARPIAAPATFRGPPAHDVA